MMLSFTQPDRRFPVLVATAGEGNRSYMVFVSAIDDRPARSVSWVKPVTDANVLFVGDVEQAVRGLLLNYRNAELREKLGMSDTVAAKLRDYLKIGGKGQRH